jgi:hypothetical protein
MLSIEMMFQALLMGSTDNRHFPPGQHDLVRPIPRMLQHGACPDKCAVLFWNRISKPLLNTWSNAFAITTSQYDGPHGRQLGLDSHDGPPGNVKTLLTY